MNPERELARASQDTAAEGSSDPTIAATAMPETSLNIADSLLPSFDWESAAKRRYLSYRLCGFARTEAAYYTNIKHVQVLHWRKSDEKFRALDEQNLLQLRRQFSKDVIVLEFTRNLKLAMEVDFEVFEAAKTKGILALSKEEREYLEKARSLYGPQQLEVLERLFKERAGADWDWEALVHGKGELPQKLGGGSV